MNIDQVIHILVTITLFEMMIAVGLGVRFSQIVGVARDVGLLTRAAIANYLIVPAAAVALLLVFHAHPLVAAGFLIAAVCPGAPYGPPFTTMAKGNVAQSVGLMLILAASSAIVAPLLLKVLLPWMAGDQPLHVNVSKMVFTLIVSQLLPLGIGLFVRKSRPELAEKLQKPANKLSTVLNLIVFGLIVAVDYKTLAAIRPLGFLGMFVLAIAALAAVGSWAVLVAAIVRPWGSLRECGMWASASSSLLAVSPAHPQLPRHSPTQSFRPYCWA